MTAGRVALVLLSAAAYSATFPPLAWHWLAWVSLAPCFAVLASLTPRAAALAGLAWGVALACGTAWWLPGMIAGYFASAPWLGWVGLVVVGVVHAGIAYSVAGAWIAWAAARRAVGPLGIAVAWCGAEMLRTSVLGNPWAIAGYSQVASPTVLQVADLGGVVAVGFVVLAVNAALAALWCPAARGRHGGIELAAVVLVVAGTIGYGRSSLPAGARPAPVRVGVVQSGVGRGFRWRDEYRWLGVTEHLAPSARLHDAGAALIVWPEHAVSFYPQEPGAARDRLLAGMEALDTDVVLGAPHWGRGANGTTRYHNSVFLVRHGRLAGRYDKRRLLPLAETTGRTAYAAGVAPAVLPAASARIGALVCFEAMFPALARSAVAAGAELLVNVTNDSWFDAPAAARQHLEMAVVRAVETRRYLVRAAATGESAVVDPWGRIVAAAPLDAPATLLASVEPRDDLSPYVRAGDAPALAVVVAVLLACTRRRLTGAPAAA